MSRADLEKAGYLKSFPNLLGCVCALHGSEDDIRSAADRHAAGGDWTKSLSPADLVLSPAACYPAYPLAAARGPVPRGGLRFDVAADCFRHEPSSDLDRFQSFRMREYVCIGTAEEVTAFRDSWMARAPEFAAELGLPHSVKPASDPFFGRTGQVMAVSQNPAGPQVRVAGAAPFGGEAHRLHELQLSSRSFRHDLGDLRPVGRPGAHRAASPSAWTGWRSRCSGRTVSTSTSGPAWCARR